MKNGVKYWIPIALLMGLGSIARAALLKVMPNCGFQFILGIAFALTGVWFIIRIPEPEDIRPNVPFKAGMLEIERLRLFQKLLILT